MTRKRPIVLEAVASGLRSFRWVALVLLVLYLGSDITVVRPNEVALVLRLGQLVGDTPEEQIQQPGLLFAFPYPIDRVIRVPVKEEGEVIIADLAKAAGESGPASDVINPLKEGYCLTGDQNILQARLAAKYRITDPVAFALLIERPQDLVRDAVLAAATETMTHWRVDDVLRLRDERTQENLATRIQRSAQTRLDTLKCGLTLSALEVKEIQPPRQVKAAFEQVQSARVEKATKRRDADGFAASEIPKAEAERDRLINEAIANGSKLRARATAEVSVFAALQAEHRRNPRLVRERLYRDTVDAVMAQIGKRYFLPPQARPGDVRIYLSEPEGPP